MNLVKLSKYFIFISFLIIATGCEITDVEDIIEYNRNDIAVGFGRK